MCPSTKPPEIQGLGQVLGEGMGELGKRTGRFKVFMCHSEILIVYPKKLAMNKLLFVNG